MEGEPNDALLELQFTAARFALGLVHSWEIPPVADRALSNGVYSPALAELAFVVNPDMYEVQPLFLKALAELGLHSPSRVDAAWFIVRHCMQQIVSMAESPRAVLELVNATSQAITDVLPDRKCRGTNLDVSIFIGDYWCYSSPNENVFEGRVITDESERQALLDNEVRKEAAAWLERHGDRQP